MTSLALRDEPHATSKHTLCGYAWGDVTAALIRAIANADLMRAQRWAAELVCSELGLGRLEALLFHAWALHAGTNLPNWCHLWNTSSHQIRTIFSKAGGDIKVVRNNPIVRQLVAEAVAYLVLVTKKPMPKLPTAADCFKEAEAMRSRLRSGGGAGDQSSTRRIWAAGIDGADLRTVGNEMEAALRANQIGRMLFWIIWIITLDAQTDAPPAKERGPAHIPVKQRKSIIWFLVAVLKDIANEGNFLSLNDRNGMFGCLETMWVKLGNKGRRDCIVGIAIGLQEHLQKKRSLSLSPAPAVPYTAVQSATSTIDTIYSGIATEAQRFMLETPKMIGLTKEATEAKKVTINPVDKLQIVSQLAGFRY